MDTLKIELPKEYTEIEAKVEGNRVIITYKLLQRKTVGYLSSLNNTKGNDNGNEVQNK